MVLMLTTSYILFTVVIEDIRELSERGSSTLSGWKNPNDIEDKYFRYPTWKVLHLKMVCVQDIWGPKVQGNPNEVTKGFYIYI